jgi:uncharacterized membrane protein YiaA
MMAKSSDSPSKFLTVFIGAAIFVIGLLAATAILGSWGFYGGLVILIVIVLVNSLKSSQKIKKGAS